MIYAYLSGLHVRPLSRRDGQATIAHAFIWSKPWVTLPARQADPSIIWLRVADNNDTHLATIRIVGEEGGRAAAQINILTSTEPSIVLFACLKAIFRYALDHAVERISLFSAVDLARALPALALRREQKTLPKRYELCPQDLLRRLKKFPNNPFLVYLIEMPHHNIHYK